MDDEVEEIFPAACRNRCPSTERDLPAAENLQRNIDERISSAIAE
jgi:hypothetical protein